VISVDIHLIDYDIVRYFIKVKKYSILYKYMCINPTIKNSVLYWPKYRILKFELINTTIS